MSEAGDVSSHIVEHTIFGAALAAGFMGLVPFFLNIIASIAMFIWVAICIKESRTYIHWTRNRKMKKNARRLTRLRAKEKIVIAKIEAADRLRQARVEARALIDHEIAEAAKLVAQNDIVDKADAIVRKDRLTSKI